MMRTTTRSAAVAGYALFACTTAAAQEPVGVPPSPFEPRGAVVAYDDNVGVDEVPWDEFDDLVHYRPRGLVHWGAALRVAGVPDASERLAAGPFIELGVLLDARYRARSPWRMRFVAAVSFQPPRETFAGGGQIDWSSPLAIRLRWIPFSLDLHQWITIRAGADVGIQYVPLFGDDGTWEPLFGLESELAVRALDGVLEIALTLGCQWTGIGVVGRSGDLVETELATVVGGSVGYLFP